MLNIKTVKTKDIQDFAHVQQMHGGGNNKFSEV